MPFSKKQLFLKFTNTLHKFLNKDRLYLLFLRLPNVHLCTLVRVNFGIQLSGCGYIFIVIVFFKSVTTPPHFN